jgi:DNA-binding NarL/FixJ family response regulator
MTEYDSQWEEAVWAKMIVSRLLNTLTEREQYILRERMHGTTFREIAAEFGVVQQTIRMAEQKALRKLRHPSRWVATYSKDIIKQRLAALSVVREYTPPESVGLAEAIRRAKQRDFEAELERQRHEKWGVGSAWEGEE